MKKVAVLFMMLLACGQLALAQDPAVVVSSKSGWHKIGDVKADFKTENESISVLGKDKFKAIKLKITDAPIDINKIVVYYEDDGMQNIPLSGTMQSGFETKSYDLEYPDKGIKKVSFTYKSESNTRGDKAHVELFGLK